MNIMIGVYRNWELGIGDWGLRIATGFSVLVSGLLFLGF